MSYLGIVSTLSPTRPDLARDGGAGLGKPWLVIVLNDSHNTFQSVARALSEVLPVVSLENGLKLANTIHNQGRAVVWSGHRELAELYHEQLVERRLTMAPLDQSS